MATLRAAVVLLVFLCTASLTLAKASSSADNATDPELSGTTTELSTDIAAEGGCAPDVEVFCKDVTPGDSNLADCITRQLKLEKTAVEDTGPKVSDACRTELEEFKILRAGDLEVDTKLAKACKTEIDTICADKTLYPKAADVLKCLRERKEDASPQCKEQITRIELDAATDFELNRNLYEACKGDADTFCAGVENKDGAIQECLALHESTGVSWDCQAELFRVEEQDADDFRLNLRLVKACRTDKDRFCADVEPGDSRVKDCLEEHRLDHDFSPTCSEEFDKMLERRSEDFRLDPRMRRYCKDDIKNLCDRQFAELEDVPANDAAVTQCLQDYQDELRGKCRSQVHKVIERASEDIRFDRPLADSCKEDRQRLCQTYPDGNGLVFRCLQDHRDELKHSCREAVFDQEVRISEDIDFMMPLRDACGEEVKAFCTGIMHGRGRMLQCLEDNLDEPDFGAACRKEVERNQLRQGEDYRLNYRLNKACASDVTNLGCIHACSDLEASSSITCHGTVLRCLQDKLEEITNEACREEVFAFEEMEVRDFRADLPFADACKSDVAAYCSGARPDHNGQLACLRTHRDRLSEACRKEELKFSIMEASDLRLIPALTHACFAELHGYCRKASPEDGEAFTCLQQNVGRIEFSAACKEEVNKQEERQASDYRLDIRLRKECEADVKNVCGSVDPAAEYHAEVLKCLVKNHLALSGECQSEVAYAVRMALFEYKENVYLTSPCDADVGRYCKGAEAKGLGGFVIGVYGQCLTDVFTKQKSMNGECSELVKLASTTPQFLNMTSAGPASDGAASATIETLTRLVNALQAQVAAGQSSLRGLVLQGPVAYISIAALVVVILALGFIVYRRYKNPRRPYRLIVKEPEV